MFAAGSREVLAVWALKFIGKNHVDQKTMQIIKNFLQGTTRTEFEKNLTFAPQWIKQILFDTMKDVL
ncbi:MAG: hypothetical protein JSR46_08850 [Verrucomicrobia bacterium]|nr:hypothetical protein [Verrucomicrobiota bacterium]